MTINLNDKLDFNSNTGCENYDKEIFKVVNNQVDLCREINEKNTVKDFQNKFKFGLYTSSYKKLFDINIGSEPEPEPEIKLKVQLPSINYSRYY